MAESISPPIGLGSGVVVVSSIAGWALLPVRFAQGFIYWGGGSRRFIYAPQKLDPSAHEWMANKFQSAMPGAILGTDHVIAYLLHHFVLLYTALIVFSAGELLCGLGLILGFMTRLSAAASILFSIALMLMFGWQGATCIDEWTMAAANLAMGATLLVGGAGPYALDNLWLRKSPGMRAKTWFQWGGGSLPLPLSRGRERMLALILFAATACFITVTYSYFRGSVLTPYHKGPVSPSTHHYSLTAAALAADGDLSFHAYVDGGTPAVPSHIMEIVLVSGTTVVESWTSAGLAHLPPSAIENDFPYNTISEGPYGLVGEVGAAARIDLPAQHASMPAGALEIVVKTVGGNRFSAPVTRTESLQ